MRRYSMPLGAAIICLINIYGVVISTIFHPITPAILSSSIFLLLTILYIELGKRRLLMSAPPKEKYFLLILLILMEIYMTVTAFLSLVYLNQYQKYDGDVRIDLSPLLVGLHSLPLSQVEYLSLPYYFGNFLAFIFYLRCFYVMFWGNNVVFVFRYLKKEVKELNQTLLAHLPKIPISSQLELEFCSLCLESYKEGEDITRLRCQHIFHLGCVKIWVQKSNCCPLCRKKVIY